MKKSKFLLMLMAILIMMSSGFTYAEDFQDFSPANLNQSERERLKGFGFTEEELDDFTVHEYKTFLDNFGSRTGKVVKKEQKYFRVNADSNTMEEITKKQAFKEVQEFREKQKEYKESDIVISALSDTKNSGWITLTLTSSESYDISEGRYEYLLKNSFQWLEEPFITLNDVIGITKSPYMNIKNSSEYFMYKYDFTKDGQTVTSYNPLTEAQHASSYGLAFDWKLARLPNSRNHRGYMSYKVFPASKQYTSAEVRGAYSHLTLTFSFGVDLSSGGMSITGSTAHTDAIPPYFTFTVRH